MFIHEKAVVENGANIGDGTKIWVNSQVRSGATIGENCVIGKDTFIDSQVKIGSRVKIQNGVSVFNGVTLGDDVFVGPNAVFTNDKVPRAFNTDWQITPTLVGRGASVGANATIICGVTLGEYSMVAAGSVVTKSVPSHGLVVGNPAKLIGYVCVCGTRLSDDNVCPKCGKKTEVTDAV